MSWTNNIFLLQVSMKNQKIFNSRVIKMCVSPDSLNTCANQQIGYILSLLKWLIGEKLTSLDVKIVNKEITSEVVKDQNIPTNIK